MMTRLLLTALLVLCFPANAQSWFKVAPAGLGNIAKLPAGTSYRFGGGSNWCDTVVVAAPTTVTVLASAIKCTVNGVAVADPNPPGSTTEELDVIREAAPYQISTVINGAIGGWWVPALPTPPSSPAVVSSAPATLNVYSDAHFECVPSGPLTAKLPEAPAPAFHFDANMPVLVPLPTYSVITVPYRTANGTTLDNVVTVPYRTANGTTLDNVVTVPYRGVTLTPIEIGVGK